MRSSSSSGLRISRLKNSTTPVTSLPVKNGRRKKPTVQPDLFRRKRARKFSSMTTSGNPDRLPLAHYTAGHPHAARRWFRRLSAMNSSAPGVGRAFKYPSRITPRHDLRYRIRPPPISGFSLNCLENSGRRLFQGVGDSVRTRLTAYWMFNCHSARFRSEMSANGKPVNVGGISVPDTRDGRA